MNIKEPIFVIPLVLPFKKEIIPSQFRLFSSILENGYLLPGSLFTAISSFSSSNWSFLSPGTNFFLQTLSSSLDSIKKIPFKTHFIYDTENEIELLNILSRKGFSASTINYILEEKNKPVKIDKFIDKIETIFFRFSHFINDLASSFLESENLKEKSKKDLQKLLNLLSDQENLIITTNADLLIGNLALILKMLNHSRNFVPHCKIIDLRSLAYHINLATSGDPSISPLNESILSPLTLSLYENIQYNDILENASEKQNSLDILKETYSFLSNQLTLFQKKNCIFTQKPLPALPSLKKAILFHSKIILTSIANLRKEGIPIDRTELLKQAFLLLQKGDEPSIKTYHILKDILLWTFNSRKVYPHYDFLTRTGRIILKYPAIFRLPKNLKTLLPLTEMDYSQMEVRVFAGLFQRKKLLNLLSNQDLYEIIAKELNLPSRNDAKINILKSLYGGTPPPHIQNQITSLLETNEIKKIFQTITSSQSVLISTISGRLRKLKKNSYPHFINTIVQGSTTDLIFARLYQLFKTHPEITINTIIQDAIYTTIKDEQTLEIVKTFMEKLNEIHLTHGKCESVFSIKIAR